MQRDMNFLAATMRYQTRLGFVTDKHAVVSCTECHAMMLAMNLQSHTEQHVRGGTLDPTVQQVAH
jgi:hypothetical protein